MATITHLLGPVQTGSIKEAGGTNAADMGTCILAQYATLVQNGATAVSATLKLPPTSKIVDILVDVEVAWDSATSDTLSVGTAAAGTQYASGVDVKAATGRIRPTFTAAQLTAMKSTSTNRSVVVTVTPVGAAATVGTVTVTVLYVQTA